MHFRFRPREHWRSVLQTLRLPMWHANAVAEHCSVKVCYRIRATSVRMHGCVIDQFSSITSFASPNLDRRKSLRLGHESKPHGYARHKLLSFDFMPTTPCGQNSTFEFASQPPTVLQCPTERTRYPSSSPAKTERRIAPEPHSCLSLVPTSFVRPGESSC
jgi:hypothetical protein